MKRLSLYSVLLFSLVDLGPFPRQAVATEATELFLRSRCAEIGMPRMAAEVRQVDYRERLGGLTEYWAPFCTPLWVDEYDAVVLSGRRESSLDDLLGYMRQQRDARYPNSQRSGAPAQVSGPPFSETKKDQVRQDVQRSFNQVRDFMCHRGDVRFAECQTYFHNFEVVFCHQGMPTANQPRQCRDSSFLTVQAFTPSFTGIPVIPFLWPDSPEEFRSDEELVQWVSGSVNFQLSYVIWDDNPLNSDATVFRSALLHEFSHMTSFFYVWATANDFLTRPASTIEKTTALQILYDFGLNRSQITRREQNWYRSLFLRFGATDETFHCFTDFLRSGGQPNSLRRLGGQPRWMYYEESFANFLALQLPILIPEMALPNAFTAQQIGAQCNATGDAVHPGGPEVLTCVAQTAWLRRALMDRVGCRN